MKKLYSNSSGSGSSRVSKITMQDVELVVREVWGGKCAVTGHKMGDGE